VIVSASLKLWNRHAVSNSPSWGYNRPQMGIDMSASKIRLPLAAVTVLFHHSMVYLSIQPETLLAAMPLAAVASNGK
jgi:hypothetical protein